MMVRTAGGYAKNGITYCHWRRHITATVGNLVPQGPSANWSKAMAAKSALAAWYTCFNEAASSLRSFQEASVVELRIRCTMQV